VVRQSEGRHKEQSMEGMDTSTREGLHEDREE